MKFKILSLAVMGILLSACNSSDDDAQSSPDISKEKVTEYYSFDFMVPGFQEYEDSTDHLLAYAEQYSLVNGIFYVKDNLNVSPKYPRLDDEEYAYTYVTDKGIFEQDTEIVTNLGAKDVVVLEQSVTQWVTRPATIPDSPIRDTYTLKWHDLSGQKMTSRTNLTMQKVSADSDLKDLIDPNKATTMVRQKYNQAAQTLLKLQQEKTFPQGAQCFQYVSLTPKVEYVLFDEGSKSTQPTLELWAKNVLEQSYAKAVTDGEIYNLKYKKAQYSDIEPSFVEYFGAIEYQNKIMNIELSQVQNFKEGEERFYKRVVDLILEAGSDRASQNQAKLFAYSRQSSGALEGCDGYNKVAAQAIEQIIQAAQPK